MFYAGYQCGKTNGKKLISDGAEESASSLSLKDQFFELSMSMCNSAMEYFALEEMDAAEVIEYICLMRTKGQRASNSSEVPKKRETKRRVYADQANWY